jgi:hypothetical protein
MIATAGGGASQTVLISLKLQADSGNGSVSKQITDQVRQAAGQMQEAMSRIMMPSLTGTGNGCEGSQHPATPAMNQAKSPTTVSLAGEAA